MVINARAAVQILSQMTASVMIEPQAASWIPRMGAQYSPNLSVTWLDFNKFMLEDKFSISSPQRTVQSKADLIYNFPSNSYGGPIAHFSFRHTATHSGIILSSYFYERRIWFSRMYSQCWTERIQKLEKDWRSCLIKN